MPFIPIYTPSRGDYPLLEKTHVGRHALLDALMDSIRASARGRTVQHWLLIGPRGIGKSHLVCLLHGRLRRDCPEVFPVMMPEEGQGIVNLAQFMERIVDSMLGEMDDLGQKDERLDGFYQRLRDEQDESRLRDLVADFLVQWTDNGRRKLVLFAENLDRVWGERALKGDLNQKWLRNFLMNDPPLILVGTAVAPFADIDWAGAPLYNLFHVEYPQEFSFEEFCEYLLRLAETHGPERLARSLRETRWRLRALYALTGGNPRVAVILFDVLSAFDDLPRVEEAFFKHMNLLTPYFQERVARLTAQQEQILVAFAGEKNLLTPSEVARTTRIGRVNVVTAQLNELERHGFIRRAGNVDGGRRRAWILSERIYRLWHQYQTRRGRRLVDMFVEFIAYWHRSDELRGYLNEYTGKMSMLSAESEREPFQRVTAYLSTALEQRVKIEEFLWNKAVHPLVKQGRSEEALAVLENLPETHDVWLQRGICHCLLGLRRSSADLLSEGRSDFEKAANLNPNSHDAFFNWGTALSDLGDMTEKRAWFEQALEKYAQAVAIKPDDHKAYCNWGNALSALGNLTGERAWFEQAFEKYAQAVAIKPDDHKAYSNWGTALSALGNLTEERAWFEQAFEKYAQAVAIKPDKHEAYNNWGNALLALGNLTEERAWFEQAFEKFAQAVAIKKDMHEAYYNWGNALSHLGNLTGERAWFEQAFEKFAQAVAIKPDKHETYYNWGNALSDLGSLTGERALFEQALEKYASCARILRGKTRFTNPLDFRAVLRLVALDRGDFRVNFGAVAESLPKVTPDSNGRPNLNSIRPHLYDFLKELLNEARIEDADYAVRTLLSTPWRDQLEYLERYAMLIEALRRRSKEPMSRMMPEEREIFDQLYENALETLEKKNTHDKAL